MPDESNEKRHRRHRDLEERRQRDRHRRLDRDRRTTTATRTRPTTSDDVRRGRGPQRQRPQGSCGRSRGRRSTRRAHPWLAAVQRLVVGADRSAEGRGLPRRGLRPPRLRQVRPRRQVRLRHPGRRPEQRPLRPRPDRRDPGGLLHGRGRGGPLPANPPGRSTHERRNDGVAYPGPAGAPLPYWCVGMDWSDAAAVVRAARGEGFTASITYPGNPREGHHVNFRKEPRRPFRALRRGATGNAVLDLTRRLSFVHSPLDGRAPTSTARGARSTPRPRPRSSASRPSTTRSRTASTGPSTHRQLQASVRWRKRHR